MKKIITVIVIMVMFIGVSISQVYDDIYFRPSDFKKEIKKNKIVIKSDTIDTISIPGYIDYIDNSSEYNYTNRIKRFHNSNYIYTTDYYNDIYFLNSSMWITPLWKTQYWFNIQYGFYGYNNWYYRYYNPWYHNHNNWYYNSYNYSHYNYYSYYNHNHNYKKDYKKDNYWERTYNESVRRSSYTTSTRTNRSSVVNTTSRSTYTPSTNRTTTNNRNSYTPSTNRSSYTSPTNRPSTTNRSSYTPSTPPSTNRSTYTPSSGSTNRGSTNNNPSNRGTTSGRR